MFTRKMHAHTYKHIQRHTWQTEGGWEMMERIRYIGVVHYNVGSLCTDDDDDDSSGGYDNDVLINSIASILLMLLKYKLFAKCFKQ